MKKMTFLILTLLSIGVALPCLSHARGRRPPFIQERELTIKITLRFPNPGLLKRADRKDIYVMYNGISIAGVTEISVPPSDPYQGPFLVFEAKTKTTTGNGYGTVSATVQSYDVNPQLVYPLSVTNVTLYGTKDFVVPPGSCSIAEVAVDLIDPRPPVTP